MFRVLVAVLLASAARADDVVHIEPPPPWPAQLPLPAAALPANGQAVTLRLLDRQVRVDTGGMSAFVRVVTRIDSADALAALGQIASQWIPVTHRLAVHRVVIGRGGEVIDPLARGQTFTGLRREDGLDAARLDGRLTATLQLSDLRVGDEIAQQMMIRSTAPLLAGHVEDVLAMAGGQQIDRLRLTWR